MIHVLQKYKQKEETEMCSENPRLPNECEQGKAPFVVVCSSKLQQNSSLLLAVSI